MQNINTYNQLQIFKDNNADNIAKINQLKSSFENGNLLSNLLVYAEIMYNRNLKFFEVKTHSYVDFVIEIMLIGFTSEVEAKKLLLDRIITYKRKLIAKAQAEKTYNFDIEEKTCRKCQVTKKIKFFQKKTDKSTGFIYFNNLCNECERKRRRDSYNNSENQKKSNRERQRRWRKAQKTK